MLNKNNERELAYLVKIDDVQKHPNADKLDLVAIGGWTCITGIGEFKKGDIGIFFEIDSKLPEKEPWTGMEFLASKHFRVRTQRIRGTVSQGLIIHPSVLGWAVSNVVDNDVQIVVDDKGNEHYVDDESRFLTKQLEVTYAAEEDNKRKAPTIDKYKKMAQRHPKAARTWIWRMLWKSKVGKDILFFFFGKNIRKDDAKGWPVGKFDGVNKTDQERCENMTWVLSDKTPFIRTQKCDGSSGTFILERKKKNKFEFYVCSRNVRMLNDKQDCFYGKDNYYWEAAIKYSIEDKMRDWMMKNPTAKFICWQGEICAPGIQGNPQNLTTTHLFCFHWTDSINGRRDIRDAAADWKLYSMEVVPIVDEVVLPDNFEEFKKSADGKYDPSVCEGDSNCDREGFVYYKTTDPTFSFKNVSKKYLLKKQ